METITADSPFRLRKRLDRIVYCNTLCMEVGEIRRKNSDLTYDFSLENGSIIPLTAIGFDTLCEAVCIGYLDLNELNSHPRRSLGYFQAKSIREQLIPNGLLEHSPEWPGQYILSEKAQGIYKAELS